MSNRRSIESADLVRLRTPRSTDDVCKALADVARAVLNGSLTPSAAREVTTALNSIARVKADEATLSELRRLSDLLEQRDGDRSGAVLRLLESMDAKGGDG